MKKTTKIVFLLITVLIGVIVSCDSDEAVKFDDRLAGKEGLVIEHNNPITGEPYTNEELEELTYNPLEKESYSEGQPIDLKIVMDAKPLSIKVTVAPLHDVVIAEINTFTQVDGKYVGDYSTTLEDRGLLEVGDKQTILFSVSYDDLGVNGFDYNSLNRIAFELKKRAPFDPFAGLLEYFVYLKKQTGEVEGLTTTDAVTSKAKDIYTGASVKYNGVDNFTTIDESDSKLNFRYTGDFSIGFWVKTTSTDSDPVMLGDQDWDSSGNTGLTVAFRGDNWRVAISDGTTKADARTAGLNIPFNDGDWHFLSATFDRDGDMNMYQDGVLVATEDMSAVGSIGNGNPLRIAQDGPATYSQFFEGNIGNTYIYDYVLTPEQIANESSLRTGVELRKQDGSTKNIEVTNSGGDISSEAGRFSYTFNGVDQYATIADTGDLGFRHTGDYSIAFWVNTTSTDSDPVMIGDQDWGSSSNAGLTVAFRGDNWRVATSDGAGNKADARTEGLGIPFNDNEWHLLVATFDRDGDLSMYQDGTKVASANNLSTVVNSESGNPLRMAQDGPATYGQFFEGKIANTIIFDYVLSETEVADLFANE
ncbi:LamG domain-containing protein [Flavivirga spongiicola]|uniref:LamG domain-containing protein n=1 Tax=Flavivirga spongiicola TaxID=421621 RepID=A0ABU7XP56_9FLAO|nr:LamG domain-containing protein [Flavivirga sp. MEBiC05379]MDO5977355.1 LamG domain-containing protein [Flavivirga sp. MEBiC05379]